MRKDKPMFARQLAHQIGRLFERAVSARGQGRADEQWNTPRAGRTQHSREIMLISGKRQKRFARAMVIRLHVGGACVLADEMGIGFERTLEGHQVIAAAHGARGASPIISSVIAAFSSPSR
jgi:hypothetical protein